MKRTCSPAKCVYYRILTRTDKHIGVKKQSKNNRIIIAKNTNLKTKHWNIIDSSWDNECKLMMVRQKYIGMSRIFKVKTNSS